MSEKKEIKINKKKLKMNISTIILSVLISFIFLFEISLFGDIEVYNSFSNPRTLVYKGFLADKENGYFGNGNLEEHQKNYLPNSMSANGGIQDDSWFTVNNNFLLGYKYFNKITFKHKFFVFYLPLILFDKFWLWMLLSIFIFLLLQLNSYIESKYSLKFE